jgi:hypothetical protein
VFLAYPLARLKLPVIIYHFVHFLRIGQCSGGRNIFVSTGKRGTVPVSLLDIRRFFVMGLFGFFLLKMEAAPGADFNPFFAAVLVFIAALFAETVPSLDTAVNKII